MLKTSQIQKHDEDLVLLPKFFWTVLHLVIVGFEVTSARYEP